MDVEVRGCRSAKGPESGWPPGIIAREREQGRRTTQQEPSPHQEARCSRRRSAASIPSISFRLVTGGRSTSTASTDSGAGSEPERRSAAARWNRVSARIAGHRRSPATAGSTDCSDGVAPSRLTTTLAPSTGAHAPWLTSAQGATEGALAGPHGISVSLDDRGDHRRRTLRWTLEQDPHPRCTALVPLRLAWRLSHRSTSWGRSALDSGPAAVRWVLVVCHPTRGNTRWFMFRDLTHTSSAHLGSPRTGAVMT